MAAKKKTKTAPRTGYDIGGGEYSSFIATHTIVDYLPPHKIAEYNGCSITDLDYVWADLRCDRWWKGLEPRKDIYVGAVVRYFGDPHGTFDPNAHTDRDVYERFARGLNALTLPGGTLGFREHPALIREVMKYLPGFVNIDNPDLEQEDSEDPESDCNVSFRKS